MAARATASAAVPSRKSSTTAREGTGNGGSQENGLDFDEDDEEDEESEEEIKAREQEKQTTELVDAAHTLFGSRNVAQADYERCMRDRIHEVRSSLLLSFSCGQTLLRSFLISSVPQRTSR